MGNLKLGFLLMIVGMATVFAILLLVIYGSRLLIVLVNKVAPEEEKAVRLSAQPAIDGNARAVLDAAVAQITGGKGRITKITRI